MKRKNKITTGKVQELAKAIGLELTPARARTIAKKAKTASQAENLIYESYSTLTGVKIPKKYSRRLKNQKGLKKLELDISKALTKFAKTGKQSDLDKIWWLKMIKQIYKGLHWKAKRATQLVRQTGESVVRMTKKRFDSWALTQKQKNYTTTTIDMLIRAHYEAAREAMKEQIINWRTRDGKTDEEAEASWNRSASRNNNFDRPDDVMEYYRKGNYPFTKAILKKLEELGIIENLKRGKQEGVNGEFGYIVVDSGEIISPE